MNKNMKKILMVVIGVAALALATVKVDAGQGNWDSGSFTLPAALSSPATNAYSTSTGSTSYTITPGASLALTTSIVGAGTNGTTSDAITNGFDLYDGQRWTTTQPIRYSVTCFATTNTVGGTNLSAAQLAGWQAIRPGGRGTPNGTNTWTCADNYSSFH
jgi:hypothetical protein